MKKIIEKIVIFFTTIFLCSLPLKLSDLSIPNIPTIKEDERTIPPEEIMLEKMTTQQKVGQLFMFGFNGTTLSDGTRKHILENNIGSLILFSRNIQDTQQLKRLTSEIQSITNTPLFISIDQEGGSVARLKGNPILTTSQKEMQTSIEAYNISKERGYLLRDLGINMNLAPVVEYITNTDSFMYSRVFSGSRQEVTQKSIACVLGYMESKVVPVPKHYPGHSNDSPDSHFYLPKVYIKEDQWDGYISPFKMLIGEGCVDAIMVGHILFPNIDSKTATISTKILNERLRNELSFEGIIISDDMEMDAIEKQGEYTTIAKEALLAGVDILIYSTESNVQQQVYDYILQSVVSGEISEDILNEKVIRILKLKLKYNIINPNTIQPSQE